LEEEQVAADVGTALAVVEGEEAAEIDKIDSSASSSTNFESQSAIENTNGVSQMALLLAQQNATAVAKVASMAAQLGAQDASMRAEQAEWARQQQIYVEDREEWRIVREQFGQMQQEVGGATLQ
jgi:hypothetical protein